MRYAIQTENSPTAPYSPAIVAEGKMVFISGQLPLNLETGKPHGETFRAQAEFVFQSIENLLIAAGSSWDNVIRMGVFLADLSNFGELNQIYRQYVTANPPPARTTIQAGLPPGFALEIDCIALLPHE